MPQTCLQCITIRIYISVEWQPTLHYRQYLSRCKFGISFKCKMGDTVSRRGAEFRMESITLRRSQAFVNDNEGGIFGGKNLEPIWESNCHHFLKENITPCSKLKPKNTQLYCQEGKYWVKLSLRPNWFNWLGHKKITARVQPVRLCFKIKANTGCQASESCCPLQIEGYNSLYFCHGVCSHLKKYANDCPGQSGSRS